MPDPFQDVPPPTTPPPSSTGVPVVSSKLVPYFTAALIVSASIAGASQLDLGLPKQVFGWATLASIIFAALLGLTPGARKSVPMVLLVLGIGFSSCATTGPALLITADSLDAAAKTFHVTATTIEQLNAAGELTAQQREDYNQCLPIFQESYHAACRIWRAAAGSQDKAVKDQVEALIAVMLAEIQPFIELAATAHGPLLGDGLDPMLLAVDGGAP